MTKLEDAQYRAHIKRLEKEVDDLLQTVLKKAKTFDNLLIKTIKAPK